MPGNVWVVAEQWQEQITDITYEALALGREVADQLGVRLECLLPGSGMKDLAASLGKADAVLYADHPLLKEPLVDPHAAVLAQLAKERAPEVMLVPLTNVTLGVGTLVGAELGIPAVNFCQDVRVSEGRIEATCLLYGGKMDAVITPLRTPVVLGLWPGSRPADNGRSAEAPPVEEVDASLPETTPVRLARYVEPEAGDVDITQKDILVAVGRGIQSQDNLALAEELAETIGGAVCGSRPVIDQGWLPLSRQIGKSGLTVKPKLYLALGISGAPEHVEGMKNSQLIVAVNTDPQAPIFSIAHYGIAADVLDVIPALKDSLLAKRG